jgi:hypothetical protein
MRSAIGTFRLLFFRVFRVNVMEAEHFFGWFKSHGGSIDEESVGLSYFEDTRCQGAVALHDIPV